MAGEKWNDMSGEQKQPYKDTYKQKKAKFDEEMKAYELKKQNAPTTTTDAE